MSSHDAEVFARSSAQYREVVRRGEAIRIYRRANEELATYAAFLLLFATMTAKLISALSDSAAPGDTLALGLLVGVYVLIPGSFFFWTRRVGVYVSPSGIRNISFDRTSSTDWSDVVRFVVDEHTRFTACVLIEHPNGSRTPLNALARRAQWKSVLDPFCDALNSELTSARRQH